MIAGMLSKNNFLDLIRNFTAFEPVAGRVIKKLARYQPFRSVHKTIQRLKTGQDPKQKGGGIWLRRVPANPCPWSLAVKSRRDADLRDYKRVFITPIGDRPATDSDLWTY